MAGYALFDLDGTLTDPKVGITTCVQFALAHYGIQVDNLDDLEPFIGPPLKDSFMNFYGFSEEQAIEAIEVYRSRFSTIGLFENELYAGIDHLLSSLREAGWWLSVASSKPTIYVERILEHFQIRQYFHYVVGSFLDGRRVVKDEIVEEALRLLEVTEANKKQGIMIGDRMFDVQGAKAHGIPCAAVSYGYGTREELEDAAPDYIVDSVEELETLLLSLQKTN